MGTKRAIGVCELRARERGGGREMDGKLNLQRAFSFFLRGELIEAAQSSPDNPHLPRALYEKKIKYE